MHDFELKAPPEELVAATRQAIADATYFDKRDINRNFDYDYEAYEAVKRNLTRLIDLGHLRSAMDLSLELMSQGKPPDRGERRGFDDRRRQGMFGGSPGGRPTVRPAGRRGGGVVYAHARGRQRGVRL